MCQPLRIVLLVESSRGFGRSLLAGVAAYARIFGPWTFHHEERALGDPMPTKLRSWRPQGVIARLETKALARGVVRLGLPTVNVSSEEKPPRMPIVGNDDQAIARAAAEHLLARRLRHFAYCGLPGVRFSEERGRHFVRCLAPLGHRVRTFRYRRSARAGSLAEIEQDAMQHADELAAWLLALPKPAGLMACNDMRAYQVLSACRERGILVPDEVAVIGVDNDAVQCDLCDPTLSSIDNNARRVGYEAAALLHQMIERRGSVPRTVRVPPSGVVTRRSTDALAIADRDMIEIARHVRDHACEGLTPGGLARHTALSRSTLERWFAKHFGHTVNDEISRVRLDRVRELLIHSDVPLGEIARLAGFSHAETMQRLFKNVVGETPGRYRRNRRIVGATDPVAKTRGDERHASDQFGSISSDI
jgi:LacI family transcriptional regulator